MAPADDHHTVLLAQDGLIHCKAAVKVRQQVRHSALSPSASLATLRKLVTTAPPEPTEAGSVKADGPAPPFGDRYKKKASPLARRGWTDSLSENRQPQLECWWPTAGAIPVGRAIATAWCGGRWEPLPRGMKGFSHQFANRQLARALVGAAEHMHVWCAVPLVADLKRHFSRSYWTAVRFPGLQCETLVCCMAPSTLWQCWLHGESEANSSVGGAAPAAV
eukprot:365763-Chlamydomonas_euryale.AAC.12